jgi:hypothetical protein
VMGFVRTRGATDRVKRIFRRFEFSRSFSW